MYVVRRTKTARRLDALAPGVSGKEGPETTAVHWAAAVAPGGNVTAWTADRDKALELTDEAAERVRKRHAGLANVGTVELLPVAAAPAPAPAESAEEKLARLEALLTEARRENTQLLARLGAPPMIAEATPPPPMAEEAPAESPPAGRRFQPKKSEHRPGASPLHPE